MKSKHWKKERVADEPFVCFLCIQHKARVKGKDDGTKKIVDLRGDYDPRSPVPVIRISYLLNQTLEEWLCSYVHENLHHALTLFVRLLFDVKFTEQSEHDFILSIEQAISKRLKMLKTQ